MTPKKLAAGPEKIPTMRECVEYCVRPDVRAKLQRAFLEKPGVKPVGPEGYVKV